MTSPPKSDLEGTPSIRNRRANRLPCYWITPGELKLCDYHIKICRKIQVANGNKRNNLPHLLYYADWEESNILLNCRQVVFLIEKNYLLLPDFDILFKVKANLV